MRKERVRERSSVRVLPSRWRVAALALGALLLTVAFAGRPSPVGAQFTTLPVAGGLNINLTASPPNPAVGQVVTFSYRASPPAVAPPFASITSLVLDYGDGSADTGNIGAPGQTVTGSLTHVYGAPGSYTATLSATASNGGAGSNSATVTVGGGGGGGGGLAPSVSVTASPSTASVGQPVSFFYSATTSFGISFPSIRSMLISYGDGSAPLPLNPPSGSVSRSYSSPGYYNVVVTATDSNGLQGQGSTTVQVFGGGPSPIFQPPGNVQIINPPFTAAVGQPVTFNAATAVALNPGAYINSYTWTYGDGGTDSGQSVSHTYFSPGTFPVTLTVTDSTGASAQANTSITIGPSGPPIPPPTPGIAVTYQPGWNLIAAPNGTSVPAASGPLYTYQSGYTAYQTVYTTQAGWGYWAFFPSGTTVTIPYTGAQNITRGLPPGQFIMIGNSSSSPATVFGADIVYTYNAATGYQQTTFLQPGQAAWALSFTGGNVTISSPGP